MRWARSGILLLLGCGQDPVSVVAPSVESKFPWYLCIHGSEVGYDLEKADLAFDRVLDLGGTGVRTDVFWHEVEPQRDLWDADRIDFYQGYVTQSFARGLDPLIILSGAPSWAITLYTQDKAAFWVEYEDYVRRVVSWVGPQVVRYQIWNEPNSVLDPIDQADDWQLFARGGAILRERDPGAVLCVNAVVNWIGWEEAVTDWLAKAGEWIDVIGVDHYPGTWAVGSFTNWWPVDRLLERIQTPGDPWYGKQGAVMETGYSSWAAVIADETVQKTWVQQALPVLRDKVKAGPVVLGAFYQLIDVDTAGWGQEVHFGILHSNFAPKPAYFELKKQIAQF